jgi:hypothetical protein
MVNALRTLRGPSAARTRRAPENRLAYSYGIYNDGRLTFPLKVDVNGDPGGFLVTLG